MLCNLCNQAPAQYSKKGICKKCYMKDYNKKYLSDPLKKQPAKERATNHYYNNHDNALQTRKKYREKVHFNSKRQSILLRDNFTCTRCNNSFEENMLTIHHEDRNGRNTNSPNNDDENLITLCRSCHAKEHYNEMKKAQYEKYKDKWSIKYDKCIECGTTERKHKSKGLCANCSARKRRMKI